MSQLPETKTKVLKRRRVLANNGTIWNTWWTELDDGTVVIDPNYHTQLKKGEYRYIVETEVRTIFFSEE